MYSEQVLSKLSVKPFVDISNSSWKPQSSCQCIIYCGFTGFTYDREYGRMWSVSYPCKLKLFRHKSKMIFLGHTFSQHKSCQRFSARKTKPRSFFNFWPFSVECMDDSLWLQGFVSNRRDRTADKSCGRELLLIAQRRQQLWNVFLFYYTCGACDRDARRQRSWCHICSV